MPVLSIIVPVYNTKRYLHECLKSILCQNYTDFEVLLIDDGSTDGSGLACDNYAVDDSRIRVIHKENGGVSSARNAGLDNALGEWVFFLDSDDLLPDNALESLMRYVNDDVDMVYGGLRKFSEDNKNIETIVSATETMTPVQAVDSAIFPSIYTGDWQRYIVNRISRRSIIESNNLRFREDIYYKEDGLFLISYLVRSTKAIVCIPDIVYLYRQVPESAMNSLETSFNPKLFTLLDAHGEIITELRKLDAPEIKKRELWHLFHNRKWILGKLKKTGADNRENLKILRSELIKNGGFLNYVYYIVFLYYGKVFIQSISRRINNLFSKQ